VPAAGGVDQPDLSTFLATDDEWIATRTGMKERRISHVPGIELATVAAERAIACAGLRGADIDLVIYGSCSNDEAVPNSASAVQRRIGATRAAAFDVNTPPARASCTDCLSARR
jgi:3-oxoacyl-[acyl-carrier-protein] synthase-3